MAKLTALLLASLALFVGTTPALALQMNVDPYTAWLATLEQDAIADGISAEAVHDALDQVVPNDAVVALDQKQPETTVTFDSYVQRIVSNDRIEQGRDLLRKDAPLLNEISQKYGVPPEVIVALWGIESNFGRNSGKYQIVESLVSLAYEGRRAAFFRKELLNALHIIDQDAIPASSLMGSWAGAMGQCQFMPSTYLHYAVHYTSAENGNDAQSGPNIWDNTADVFASIANYLSAEGWRRDLTWGHEVRFNQATAADDVGLTHKKTPREWAEVGAVNLDGSQLLPEDLDMSLIQPDGAEGRSFLVYDSYRAIMRWNRSTYFATAVGLLADRIRQ